MLKFFSTHTLPKVSVSVNDYAKSAISIQIMYGFNNQQCVYSRWRKSPAVSMQLTV